MQLHCLLVSLAPLSHATLVHINRCSSQTQQSVYNSHPSWSFTISEIETLTGQLGYIVSSSPWLRYLMPHFYTSIAVAFKHNKAFLIHAHHDFRTLLREAQGTSKFQYDAGDDDEDNKKSICVCRIAQRQVSFTQSTTAKAIRKSIKFEL